MWVSRRIPLWWTAGNSDSPRTPRDSATGSRAGLLKGLTKKRSRSFRVWEKMLPTWSEDIWGVKFSNLLVTSDLRSKEILQSSCNIQADSGSTPKPLCRGPWPIDGLTSTLVASTTSTIFGSSIFGGLPPFSWRQQVSIQSTHKCLNPDPYSWTLQIESNRSKMMY